MANPQPGRPPRRVQMSRQRPWRAAHPDAVIVARPSRWGNPYQVVRHRAESGCEGWAVEDVRTGRMLRRYPHHSQAVDYAIGKFRSDIIPTLDLAPLAGSDLACWCPLVDATGNRAPCHADVLLDLANSEATAHHLAQCDPDLAGGTT
jgi:hypothetical protein